MKQNTTIVYKSEEALSFKYDYSDCFRYHVKDKEKAGALDIYDFAEAFFQPPPKWFQYFLKLRDKLVSPFNLKTGKDDFGNDEPKKYEKWEVGSKVGLFKLYAVSENEMVFGENDKHLDFRVVMIYDKENGKGICIVTTLVKYNNSFGKVYFFFVKPFHRLFVPKLIQYNFKKL